MSDHSDGPASYRTGSNESDGKCFCSFRKRQAYRPSYYRNPDTVTFHIIDYGKGIDEQTIPLILKGEYTAPRTSDTHRGMGIGLSICNTIVQAHGGKIAAHNHADGAEFLFTLPKEDT